MFHYILFSGNSMCEEIDSDMVIESAEQAHWKLHEYLKENGLRITNDGIEAYNSVSEGVKFDNNLRAGVISINNIFQKSTIVDNNKNASSMTRYINHWLWLNDSPCKVSEGQTILAFYTNCYEILPLDDGTCLIKCKCMM